MRDNAKALAAAFAAACRPPAPVVEIGSLQVPGQEGYADLRPLFPGVPFIGCDLRPGPGVDRLEDVHRLSFPDESVGTVVSVDTLEHVADPLRALREIHRVLRADGLVFLVSVFDFPIHDCPSDYWRFTPAAFRLLLEPFPCRLVGYQGDPARPHTVVGLGAKAAFPGRWVEELMAATPGTCWLREEP